MSSFINTQIVNLYENEFINTTERVSFAFNYMTTTTGSSNKELAQKLNVSERTAQRYTLKLSPVPTASFIGTVERIGYVAWCLMSGSPVSVEGMAKKLGVQPQATSRLLDKMSYVLPISIADDGKWRRC